MPMSAISREPDLLPHCVEHIPSAARFTARTSGGDPKRRRSVRFVLNTTPVNTARTLQLTEEAFMIRTFRNELGIFVSQWSTSSSTARTSPTSCPKAVHPHLCAVALVLPCVRCWTRPPHDERKLTAAGQALPRQNDEMQSHRSCAGWIRRAGLADVRTPDRDADDEAEVLLPASGCAPRARLRRLLHPLSTRIHAPSPNSSPPPATCPRPHRHPPHHPPQHLCHRPQPRRVCLPHRHTLRSGPGSSTASFTASDLSVDLKRSGSGSISTTSRFVEPFAGSGAHADMERRGLTLMLM
ncbi:hypothetical protein DFH07DRAFT_959692 [Mycena maculata]|uniref:Uncharacterized protein n=1 Tax=Mycena maculata TaxID=230809 RepID=A0AAD7J542_9AGAR|nr:hypothetical protein DFH07DRAFT_959692 [Mycena maculata]